MGSYVTKPIPTQRPFVKLGERPWGTYRQYAHNEEVTASIMFVEPGHRLSLQSHTGRAELWVVLDDGATLQVGDEIRHPKPGDEIWIPAGAKHRLSNPSNQTIRVIEVAFGNWQQEDVTRYADDYGRPEQGE